MKIIAPLAMMILSVWLWMMADQNANLGRLPDDDEVIYTRERNKVTGELLNVQIVRCRICGQVISYVQYNLRGKVVYGYVYSHHCGKYKNRSMGSDMLAPVFPVSQWLDQWQERLSLRSAPKRSR